MKCLILSLLLSAFAYAANEPAAFDESGYFKTCGGKIYPTCNDPKLNQTHIFAEAQKLAKETNRKLIIIEGFDECPVCVKLHKVMTESADPAQVKRLNSQFVIAKLHISGLGIKELNAKYKLVAVGAPTAFITTTKGDFVKMMPGGATSLKGLIDSFESVSTGNEKEYDSFPKGNIGSAEAQNRVRLSLLKKPIALDPTVLPLVSQKAVLSSKNETAIKYYYQGLFHLFTFNYIDSVRSLKMAIDLDSNFPEAYLALSDDFKSLGADDESIGALIKADSLVQKAKPSLGFIDTLKLKELSNCYTYGKGCKAFGLNQVKDEKTMTKKYRDAFAKAYQSAAAANDLNLIVMLVTETMDAKVLETVIKFQPNHIGARHFLVHAYEAADDYKTAVIHGQELARLAPNSTHAQHMFGHVLPKVGRWNDAVKQFELADALHRKWIAENGSNVEEDWHYRHNLDLLSHAYNWNKDYEKAGKGWELLCKNFGDRYCNSYTSFLISTGKLKEAEAVLKQQEKDGVSYALTAYLQDIKNSDIKQNVAAYLAEAAANKDFNATILYYLLMKRDTKEVRTQIVEAVQSSLQQAGFDSWSVRVLNAQVYAKVAEMLGDQALAADLRLTAASVGFVCKGAQPKAKP